MNTGMELGFNPDLPSRCADPCQYFVLNDEIRCCFTGAKDWGIKEWACKTSVGSEIPVDPFPEEPTISTTIIRNKYGGITLNEFCLRVSAGMGGEKIHGNPAVFPFKYW